MSLVERGQRRWERGGALYASSSSSFRSLSSHPKKSDLHDSPELSQATLDQPSLPPSVSTYIKCLCVYSSFPSPIQLNDAIKRGRLHTHRTGLISRQKWRAPGGGGLFYVPFPISSILSYPALKQSWMKMGLLLLPWL